MSRPDRDERTIQAMRQNQSRPRVTYRVQIEATAWKSLMALPFALQDRLFRRIEALEHDPRPAGVEKLQSRGEWRIRVGDYRVIYRIHDDVLLVIVVQAGHRRDIYRHR